MAGAVGFEPTNAGTKTPCLANLATPQRNGACDGEAKTSPRALPENGDERSSLVFFQFGGYAESLVLVSEQTKYGGTAAA